VKRVNYDFEKKRIFYELSSKYSRGKKAKNCSNIECPCRVAGLPSGASSDVGMLAGLPESTEKIKYPG